MYRSGSRLMMPAMPHMCENYSISLLEIIVDFRLLIVDCGFYPYGNSPPAICNQQSKIYNDFEQRFDLSDVDSLPGAKRIENAEGCQAGGCEFVQTNRRDASSQNTSQMARAWSSCPLSVARSVVCSSRPSL